VSEVGRGFQVRREYTFANESEEDVEALAEQMGVLPEDVNAETVLGYVEELAESRAAPREQRPRSYARVPEYTAAEKLEILSSSIREGEVAKAHLVRRTGAKRDDAYADNLRSIIARGEEAAEMILVLEDGLYGSLAAHVGLPAEPPPKREPPDTRTDEEKAQRYEDENLGL
jgi:hypothetical protein